MIKLALCVFSYFKNNGIQLAFDPTNRTKLFWIIGSKIFIIGMRPDFLNFIKINTPFRIVFHEHAFVYIKFKPHQKSITVIPLDFKRKESYKILRVYKN